MKLFGLSTDYSIPDTVCTMEVFTDLDGLLINNKKIDSSLPDVLTIDYLPNASSGNILISNIVMLPNFNSTLSDTYFLIEI